MGLSQGSLLARYIVEQCDMKGTVRNYLSIGGPNMGVSDIPGCFNGEICAKVNGIARIFAYTHPIQAILGPAGYFRDPAHMAHYLKGSEFLPYLNNEAGTDEAKAAIKARFSGLNGAMLVMFTEDSVVYPKESEWFQ
jgi:palmitoyl-protein thioesterase